MSSKRQLFENVARILKLDGVEQRIIDKVENEFFPKKFTQVEAPRNKNFRAGLMCPCTPGFAANGEHFYYFQLANVEVKEDREYRLIELLMDPKESAQLVLLETPTGESTLDIKDTIYHFGFNKLMAFNPSYKLYRWEDLDAREFFGRFTCNKPTLVYSRRRQSGRFERGAIMQPPTK